MSNVKNHIERYAKTKTYNMGERDKNELRDYYAQVFPDEKKLNIRCSSCVIAALKRLSNQPKVVEVPQVESEYIEIRDMKMPELRKLAKSMGVKVAVKKVDLVHNILNNVRAKA